MAIRLPSGDIAALAIGVDGSLRGSPTIRMVLRSQMRNDPPVISSSVVTIVLPPGENITVSILPPGDGEIEPSGLRP